MTSRRIFFHTIYCSLFNIDSHRLSLNSPSHLGVICARPTIKSPRTSQLHLALVLFVSWLLSFAPVGTYTHMSLKELSRPVKKKKKPQSLFVVWYGSCLQICICTTCVWCPWKQKRASDPLELELQTVESYRVGVGNLSSVRTTMFLTAEPISLQPHTETM